MKELSLIILAAVALFSCMVYVSRRTDTYRNERRFSSVGPGIMADPTELIMLTCVDKEMTNLHIRKVRITALTKSYCTIKSNKKNFANVATSKESPTVEVILFEELDLASNLRAECRNMDHRGEYFFMDCEFSP